MNWTFKLPPWVHQLEEYEYSKDFISRALLWQMRTGKTKVIIDTATHLYMSNKIDAVLIVTRSGVHSNWIRKELPKHCAIPYEGVWWQSDSVNTKQYQHTLKETLKSEALIFLAVNHEIFTRGLAKKFIRKLINLRVLLVVDESHDFGRPQSKRSRGIRLLAQRCEYKRILTGTHNGNSPLVNWNQFEILKHGALGFRRYSTFRSHYAMMGEHTKKSGKRYPVVEGYQRLDELQTSIDKWSSTLKREDCPDLPELITSSYDVFLSDIQHRAYRKLKKEFKLDLENGRILTASEAAVRQLKLQQVLSNFVIDTNGAIHTIDHNKNPRINALMEILEDLDGKTIIWCWFTEDIRRVTAHLQGKGYPFVEYHGKIGKVQRFEAEDRFTNVKNCRYFVAQPRAAGIGLDLSAAKNIVWYSHTTDSVIRAQANDRATEKGSHSVAVIDLHTPGSVEDRIEEIHQNRKNVNSLMDMYHVNWKDHFLESLRKDEL